MNRAMKARRTPHRVSVGAPLVLVIGIVAIAAMAAACGGPERTETEQSTEADTQSVESSGNDDAAAGAVQAQIERGQEAYGEFCASCHGPRGLGTAAAPPVVGPDALPLEPPGSAQGRTTRFETALDVAKFVVESMPPGDPKPPSEQVYWDILAFDLAANGVELQREVDAEYAAEIELH